MSFGEFISLIFAITICIILFGIINSTMERKKIDAMNPEDRNNYVFGQINAALICPHCQSKGSVHAKKVARIATSTGKSGGIFKTNTTSTVTTTVTQHHCDHCNSTWDI